MPESAARGGATGRAGLDSEPYSGHSLRASLVAVAGGPNRADLMRQTRHKSTQVALAYVRPTDLWRNNVTEGVFGSGKEGADPGGMRR